jgi:hypothetical protein
MKCCDVKRSEVNWNERSEVKWIEVMILGELFVLSLIYNYEALCSFPAERYLIISSFYLLFSN